MKSVTRRKFIKAALAVAAILPAAQLIKSAPSTQNTAVLTVDKNGDATLHGMSIAVDKKSNATLM